MLEFKSTRFRGIAALACVGLLALAMGVVACASSNGGDSGLSPDRISDVRVDQDAEATIVMLEGLEHPVFTAFAQQDPERIVVDLADVEADGAPEEVVVEDGLVERISFSPYATGVGEAMTRVEITLESPADYDVIAGDDGLEIRVTASLAGEPTADSDDASESGSFGAFDDDPWAIDPVAPVDGDESTDLDQAEDTDSADSPDDDAMSDTGFDADESSEPSTQAAGSEAAPAKALTGIDARDTGEGSMIYLQADGTLTAESFTLEDPNRLVIDLPGVRDEVSQDHTTLDSMHAKSVRVGAHPDKVRVVIDGGLIESPFEGRRMLPTSGGLVVALGSGAALDAAVAEVSAESSDIALATTDSLDEPTTDALEAPTADNVEEPTDAADGMDSMESDVLATPNAASDEAVLSESIEAAPSADEPADPAELAPATELAPVTIYGVEFDTQEQRDRIVVLGERTFDYLVYEPDAETVVLAIENASIDPEAAVRIAPEPGGPVSLVTAFAQPDVKSAEVRVVMTRATGLAPEISRRGSLLIVDFPRNGQVAATPPVLAPVPSEPLLANATGQEGASADTTASASPASIAPHSETPPAAVPALATGSQFDAMPASLEPPAAIGILEEGGLIDGKEYTGRRISLDFKDVEIADVLRLIAEVSDLNVIAGDEVAGRVTIRLVDVPWDQALDVILLTKSLGFMRVGNVLRIAPSEVIKQEEEMRLQERRAKEKLEDLVVKLQPVNYANVKDIEKMVKRLLSPRGSVNIDQRTNTLIMKDIPSVIDESTALIKAIDTQTPQVMIEAKIVEASLDFSREFGSVWSFGAQPFADPFNPGNGVRSDLGNDAFKLNTNSSNNAVFSNPITAAPTGIFNLAGFILDEKLNLGLQLQAAEVNGDGKVISSPRVVTLDNSEASIEQGVSIPFQTFENGDAQLEFVDAVLSLEVTPHITADKSIIMDIAVSRNAPDDSVFTLTGSPAIAKNQVETETLVKDGQTLVLGGIYVIDKSQRQARVPYLHRIPILGAAFRSDEISDSRKELLIFVTPRIVVTPQEAS